MPTQTSPDQLKSQIAELAHDLNNKLATILMYVEMAGGEEKLPPEANVAAMIKALDQAADLNRQILRLTSGSL